MYYLSSIALIFLSATSALSSPASVDSPPDAVQSYGAVNTIGLNGSGCPPGSWTTTLSTDRSSVSAVFSQFTPSVSLQSFRQNCQATIAVTVPSGKKFTVDSVKYNGYAQLESKANVVHSATAYFQAQSDQSSASATLNGPITKSVDLSNSFSKYIWSQCGATSVIVNVDISIYLDASDGADGFASVDDAKFGPFKLQDC
ncbi:hypothetical protein E1B28_002528 [Marasmius oreades]|uniref:Secreted protein n=1 Tax=Marasmius oreades TaxID=181124 RepID=A0A9P7UKU1_9AGAR|nr:uncharacterized protein E1B28_002528 [Marasmius oreades]KAG7086582.1 hypothetical protein E1B28_002528 [Marasmius oreades]